MKINPHDPAYPSHGSMGEVAYQGIPIRLELAARFMGAVSPYARPETAADMALEWADALIDAYNEDA